VRPNDVHPTPAGQTLLAQSVIDTILSTCPAASAKGCLKLSLMCRRSFHLDSEHKNRVDGC